MWVSRRQAQTAADAGALAGAISLVKEGDTATAKLSAGTFATSNVIWGENNTYDGTTAGNVSVDVSGTGAGETSLPPCNTKKGCVRVDIFRNEPDRPERSNLTRGNPLPTFFARLLGITQQGVRATATAQAGSGNEIRCLLPFAVIDRWEDNTDLNKDTTYYPNDAQTGTAGWSPNDAYEPPVNPKGTVGTDRYVGPYAGITEPTTGWTVNGDYGRQLVVKAGDTGDYSTGWSQIVDLPDDTGKNDVNFNILNCNNTPIGIATASEPCAPAPGGDTTGREIDGCVSVSTGVAQGPTVINGIKVLVDRDPDAHWSTSVSGFNNLPGGIVDAAGALHMTGPRVRPIVVFDINHYIASGCTGTGCIGKVANIMGFFIEGVCKDVQNAGQLDAGNWTQCESPNKDIVGRIVPIPGSFATDVGDLDQESAFITVIRLVR
jgi:hypothetical protein